MEILEIFTLMHWIAALFMILGLVLLIIESFVPGFGFFGIGGAVSFSVGVIIRICQGLNVTQILFLVIISLMILIAVAFIFVHSARKGVLGKTGLFENKPSIAKDYNIVQRELKRLVGKSGKTISNLDLGGKAKINGVVYDVQSIGSYIEKGSKIKVVKIKDNTIMVRKWFE